MGGSNTPVNIAGLCGSCHPKVHSDEDAAAKTGQNKKYHVLSVINQAMPHFLKERDARFQSRYTSDWNGHQSLPVWS